MVVEVTKSRSARARVLEDWADRVNPEDLEARDSKALRRIGELAELRERLEDDLTAAVLEARCADHSWSEIGMMLGVSKQAAQRKYSSAIARGSA